MLDQMIESKNHGRENTRKNSFLVATFGVFTAVLIGGWTYSLFAKSYGVGNGDFEMASLVSPVMIENEAPPPKPERPERNVSKASNKVVLEDLYEDLDRSGVPDDSMGRKNVVTARQYGIENVVKGLRNRIPEGIGRTGGPADPGCGLCDEPGGKKIPNEEFTNAVVKPRATPDPTPKVTPAMSLGVVNGIAISLPKPKYPAAAVAVRASGQVQVQVAIDEMGRVTSAAAVSGHPLLRAAAVDAARISKFTPTTLSGKPTKVTGMIIYNFVPR